MTPRRSTVCTDSSSAAPEHGAEPVRIGLVELAVEAEHRRAADRDGPADVVDVREWHPGERRGEPVVPRPQGVRGRSVQQRWSCRAGRRARAARPRRPSTSSTSSSQAPSSAVQVTPGKPSSRGSLDARRRTPRGRPPPGPRCAPARRRRDQLQLLVAGDPAREQAAAGRARDPSPAPRWAWITLSPRCRASAIRAARRRSADSRSSCSSRACSGGLRAEHVSEISHRAIGSRLRDPHP